MKGDNFKMIHMKRFVVGLIVTLLIIGLFFIWVKGTVWLVSITGLAIMVAVLWLPAILFLIAFIYDIGCKFID
jgi:hypothetical protein